MTASLFRSILLTMALVILVVPGGCLKRSYPEKQRYVFEVVREPLPSVTSPPVTTEGAYEESVGAGVLRIDRMRISPLFERKGFVYRTADDRFETDFYHEFFAAPALLLRKATGAWLTSASIFSSVIGARDPAQADWRLEGRVGELYADLRDASAPRAVMQVEFSVLAARTPKLDVVFQRRYEVEIPAESRAPGAIMAAWNRALAQILGRFEADLRNDFPRDPKAAGVSRASADRS
jgi:hypothetical protein